MDFALETVKGIDFAFKDLIESRYFPFEFSGDFDEFICFNAIDTASHVLQECGDLYVLSKKKKEIEALTYISYSELTVYDKKNGECIKTFFQNELDTIQENNKLLPLSTDVKVLSNGERYCVRLDSCISSLEYDIMEYFRESDPDFAVLDCKSGQKKIMNRLYFGDCEFYLPEILHKGVWSGYCFNENEWGCLQFDLSGEWSELENGSFISLEYDGTYLPYTKAFALTDT